MHPIDYPEEAKRIQAAGLRCLRVEGTLAEWEEVWRYYSEESAAAGFLILPEDDDVLDAQVAEAFKVFMRDRMRFVSRG